MEGPAPPRKSPAIGGDNIILYPAGMDRLSFNAPLAGLLRASDAPVIVTGAGGWLGQAALEMLCNALGDAFGRRVTAYGSSAKTMVLRGAQEIAVAPYAELAALAVRPSLIFHFAFLTRGHARQPDYVAVNREITAIMRAFITRNGAAGLFVPSSGAVYGPDRVLDRDLAANPYGVLKHEDEAIFGGLAQQLGFPAAIMRIFNLAGPYINNPNAYALACIIGDIARGGPISLRAAHPVWRSYTHIEDVLNIAASIMLNKLELGVFDTAGEAAVEIGALALRAAVLLTGQEMPIARPDWRDGKADHYLGDWPGYSAAAGRSGVKLQALDQQILDTAAYLASK